MATFALAVLLLPATAFDLVRRRIPNRLTVTGLLLGLLWHVVDGRGMGLAFSLGGIGVAGLALLLWLAGGLGAGDVKLFAAIGAWMGPLFLLWTMTGTIFGAGLLALGLVLHRGTKKGRMPLAPAIAAGAVYAYLRLHLGEMH